MDILFISLGVIFMVLGLIGSFLPVLPGPPLSWIGLLCLTFTSLVDFSNTFMVITGLIAFTVFVLDYIIPAIGTKKFGGTRSGVIGTVVGLVVGLIFLGPFGIIIGPFLGALIGELSNNPDTNKATKAAFGSFLGFLTGTFLKFILATVYAGFFCWYVLGAVLN